LQQASIGDISQGVQDTHRRPCIFTLRRRGRVPSTPERRRCPDIRSTPKAKKAHKPHPPNHECHCPTEAAQAQRAHNETGARARKYHEPARKSASTRVNESERTSPIRPPPMSLTNRSCPSSTCTQRNWRERAQISCTRAQTSKHPRHCDGEKHSREKHQRFTRASKRPPAARGNNGGTRAHGFQPQRGSHNEGARTQEAFGPCSRRARALIAFSRRTPRCSSSPH